ncbi:hypothetical protein JKP88DRAFT_282895 [Tribonema minus]|uniref:Uncharacterized protein n=1 Tax=Tribonema minus TaxID=303371 RepID=A0A835YKL6_9STRA|nr:hypothetical protein JKP88DRAFT_282895 [Tribonema minus]
MQVKQEVTDLNLEDMFEVFDKADKSISDKEVGKAGGKDAGKDIADMLGSLFGGKKE